MIRDTVYAMIYTTMLTAGMIVINYTIPPNTDALQSTITALNTESSFVPIETAEEDKPDVQVLLE